MTRNEIKVVALFAGLMMSMGLAVMVLRLAVSERDIAAI